MQNRFLIKHIVAIFLAVCLIATTSVTMFAEDYRTQTEISVSANSNSSIKAVGDVLYGKGAYFTKQTTISINMTEGNWSTDFLVTVIGNAGATYQVVMTTPGGKQYTTLITGNSGTFTNMATLVYASKGVYTFEFTLKAGDEVGANAMVEICD